MSNSRCFFEREPKLSSSERSKQMGEKVIYCDVSNNLVNLNTANPEKRNGFKYNANVTIEPTFCLINAKNYEILKKVRNGKQLMTKTPTTFKSMYNSWNGNGYEVNYRNLTVVEEGVVDPEFEMFYDKCFENHDQRNRPETWINNTVTQIPLDGNINPF